MTYSNSLALFVTMVILAAIPSASVLTVTARAATSGFIHGVLTSLGIVLGDIVFILLAILGLTLLTNTLGDLFYIIKYVAGVYLIWLGTSFWRTKTTTSTTDDNAQSSLLSSFMAGLLITLGDQKAVLFYLGLLPAFIDLTTISLRDTSIIMVITIIAVGGTKTGYAFMAHKSSALFSARTKQTINKIASIVLVAIGVLLIITT